MIDGDGYTPPVGTTTGAVGAEVTSETIAEVLLVYGTGTTVAELKDRLSLATPVEHVVVMVSVCVSALVMSVDVLVLVVVVVELSDVDVAGTESERLKGTDTGVVVGYDHESESTGVLVGHGLVSVGHDLVSVGPRDGADQVGHQATAAAGLAATAAVRIASEERMMRVRIVKDCLLF